MWPLLRLPTLSGTLLGAALLLSSPVAHAQTAAVALAAYGYDFLTMTTVESPAKSLSKLLITPAFQGKTETQLEVFGGFVSADKNLEILQRNTQTINQQLSDLTVAGWELVEVHTISTVSNACTTRYLFRKARS
jgi:hypothetical protein